jgi:hypothetical protein
MAGAVMMRFAGLGIGLGGVCMQAGEGQERKPEEQKFSPPARRVGVSCANRHLVSPIPRMPHSRLRYVNWLRVDCAPRNTKLRQNYHSMANSLLFMQCEGRS